MKISLFDLLFICVGFIYGGYEIFINHEYRFSFKFSGILSIILAIWMSISCLKSLKDKNKTK
ncbi:hypothetical protein BIV60_15185 [Bacillus sp. MUM 116]|nr:hypothetical protein BIV60_15185 [Bacillus sp. MUM 116]